MKKYILWLFSLVINLCNYFSVFFTNHFNFRESRNWENIHRDSDRYRGSWNIHCQWRALVFFRLTQSHGLFRGPTRGRDSWLKLRKNQKIRNETRERKIKNTSIFCLRTLINLLLIVIFYVIIHIQKRTRDEERKKCRIHTHWLEIRWLWGK